MSTGWHSAPSGADGLLDQRRGGKELCPARPTPYLVLPLNKAKGFARTHPAMVAFGLVVLVLIVLWALIIAVVVTAYSVFI